MRRGPLSKKAHPVRCVLDSGGLTALTGASHHARAWLRWVVEHEGSICVPTPTLVECTTGDGGRDAEVNRILGVLQRAAAVLEAPDEVIARRAGRLRFAAKSDDGVDALVAAAAVGSGSPVVLLTSDPEDLERLLVHESHVHVRAV
jgi:predicted nucleic acid-binding protein